MQISTIHTLSFTLRCVGNDQHNAAMAIIKGGAASLGVEHTVMSMPLPDGEDAANRNSAVQIQSENRDRCETYWLEVERALGFIGVDVTSP